MRLRIAATVLVSGIPMAGPAPAQEPPDADGEVVPVVGQVVDHATDREVAEAVLSFHPFPEDEVLESLDDTGEPVWEGSAGAGGVFRSEPLPPGAYVVRLNAAGYESATTMIDLSADGTGPLEFELVPDAHPLEPIMVTVDRERRLQEVGFHDRRASGVGYALDRDQIENRAGSPRVSDLLASIPGTRRVPGGPGDPDTVRLRDGCVPQVIMDGAPFAFPIALDELVTVYELEAIEVYHGSAGPVQTLNDSCGTIMVWTRDPASVEGRPFSLTRAIVWAGLVAAPFVLLR